MIRMTGAYSELAGIQYMGDAGISAWCIEAIRGLFKAGIRVERALLLTAEGEHAFLLNLGDEQCRRWVAIKAGFSSGYGGEGPRTLSEALALLKAFNVPIEEVNVSVDALRRIDQSALTHKDLKYIESEPTVRPGRVADYLLAGDWGRASKAKAMRLLEPVMPWGLLDERLLDLAEKFMTSPDLALIAGFRRLEETVRQRLGETETLDSKVFAIAFMGDSPVLTWKGLPKSERIARGNLFVGAYGAFRNPRAHRELSQDWETQLSEFLALNLLFRLEASAVASKTVKQDEIKASDRLSK